MGMLFQHVSPSQIRLFRDCRRKWVRTYFEKIRSDTTAPQQLGTDIHTASENYIEHGSYFFDHHDPVYAAKVVRIAQEGKRFLPARDPRLIKEIKMDMPTFPGGPSMTGRIDLFAQYLKPVLVADHKSIKNLAYKLTKAQMRSDVQLGIYGQWVLGQMPEAEELKLQHIYYQTGKADDGIYESAQSDVIVTPREIREVWVGALDTVAEMKSVYEEWERSSTKTSLSVPANFEIKLEACNKYGGCTFKEHCGITAAFQAENAIETAFDGLENIMAQSLEELEALAGNAPSAEPGRVLPPDAPVPTGTVQAARQMDLESRVTAPKPAPARPQLPLAASVPPPEMQPHNASQGSNAGGLSLFIDCMPTKGIDLNKVIFFEDWIAPLAEQVAAENNVADIRLVDFGKGNAYLAAALRDNIPNGVMVIDTRMPTAKAAVEVLAQAAKRVVRSL